MTMTNKNHKNREAVLNQYIWLFGENVGETAENNSFYFWRYIVENHADVQAFFIMNRNKRNLLVYRKLSQRKRRFVVWRNSPRHIRLFYLADLLFVSLSFRDVQPDRIAMKSYQPLITHPLVYLQHGTLAIKQLTYRSSYANNSMFRFVYYNQKIKQSLLDVNGFRDYQVCYGAQHPRYMELVRRFRLQPKHDGTKFLWFLTWREYPRDSHHTTCLILQIRRVLSDPELQAYLSATQSELTVCFHRQFAKRDVERIKASICNVPQIRIVFSNHIDVMDEIVGHDVLITDYSSLGFDFTLLQKPVILFQPDREAFLQNRKIYCTKEELENISLSTTDELINCIVRQKYRINPFFRSRMDDTIDLEKIEQGRYIETLYQYFLNLQKNAIAFWGYDFSGIGGTVFATRGLVEGLLEKGFMVRLYTLKQQHSFFIPAGVSLYPVSRQYKAHLTDRLAAKLIFLPIHYRHLLDDPALSAIRPVCGLGISFWMKHMHASVVVSTRESLHLFLKEALSPYIQNKIYFFHCQSSLVAELFPGVLAKLETRGIEKAVFVTERNRKNLYEQFHFSNYQDVCVLGNTLDSTRSISREKIHIVEQKPLFIGASLLRISEERADDLAGLISFGKYLKNRRITDVAIDVYGVGNYVETFLNLVYDDDLASWIRYRGLTNDIQSVCAEHDFLVDFSFQQSFGMPYIEGFLNGRMVFCHRNEGSEDVLSAIPACFFDTNEQLNEKIHMLPKISLQEMHSYYDQIADRFSRSKVAQRFIDFINHDRR